MTDPGRFKDIEWNLQNAEGKILTWECVGIAVLMDIRDEMQRLNALLSCPNFQAIPATLRRISRNTTKPKKQSRPKQGLR